MDFDTIPELRERLEVLLRPSTHDILSMKEWLVGELSGGDGRKLTELLAQGLRDYPGSSERIELHEPSGAGLTGAEPQIVRLKMERAFDRAISELTSQGVFEFISVDLSDQVNLFCLGNGGSVRLRRDRYAHAEGVRLAPQWDRDADLSLLDRDRFTDGLEGLLGGRGRTCAEEALRCHRAGLYLAAAVLLGSTSEAAWYRICSQTDPVLASSFASGRVITRTLQLLRDRAGNESRTLANDIASHEAHLRDLRNYAAHPDQDQDVDRDLALSEAGSTALTVKTRHYLVRLRELCKRASVDIEQGELDA